MTVLPLQWESHYLETGACINIKIPSYQYRKPHCGDKTILRPSYLHNGISYTGKMPSLYWIRALGLWFPAQQLSNVVMVSAPGVEQHPSLASHWSMAGQVTVTEGTGRQHPTHCHCCTVTDSCLWAQNYQNYRILWQHYHRKQGELDIHIGEIAIDQKVLFYVA